MIMQLCTTLKNDKYESYVVTEVKQHSRSKFLMSLRLKIFERGRERLLSYTNVIEVITESPKYISVGEGNFIAPIFLSDLSSGQWGWNFKFLKHIEVEDDQVKRLLKLFGLTQFNDPQRSVNSI